MSQLRLPAFRVGDPIEGTPRVVRTLRRIDPRGDRLHAIEHGTVVRVKRVETDRRGVEVVTPAGAEISLHPSEFEVLAWAAGPEVSP